MGSIKINEAAEAICSALYRTGIFEHLGDTDGGRTTWFTAGTKPKNIRVRVERSELYPMVFIISEFPNLSERGKVHRGTIMAQVDCTFNDQEVLEATQSAVLACLELYKDVLRGTGPAGPIPREGTADGI